MNVSRLIYGVLIIISGVSAYYLMDKEDSFDIKVESNTELPIFSGQSVQNTSFDENGLRSYVITSEHLDHFAKSGDTQFDKPILKVFRQGTDQEWEVTADSAVLDKEHILTLTDNVLAKNLLPDSGFKTLSTKTLSIQLDNRDFWADHTVTLSGPQFKTVGQAMKGNFADHTAVLYNRVQGNYETLTP